MTKKDEQSTIRKTDYTFFKGSKLNLMIFRRRRAGTNLELRHQRSADCFYDVYSSEYPNGLDDKGKNSPYSQGQD